MSGLSSVASEDLEDTIKKIGVARFVGRINSGVVDAEAGYEAVDRYLSHERDRPFWSRVAEAVLSKKDVYRIR